MKRTDEFQNADYQSIKTRRLDWAKYTNFRSRNSSSDLAKLCSKLSRSELKQVFSSYDKTGLLPIHWASINNRFDLIEFMLNNESPLRAGCRNKLFADGSSLHLAAMNCSIQAASVLLEASSAPSKKEEEEQQQQQQQQHNDINQTKPKTLSLVDMNGQQQRSVGSGDWLGERDSEGQTALMRSAPPKSKRLDTVRELLRKNLWSLGAKPAEMGLFLINKGADWRETDSLFDMNLLHLAIVNDYDDIVCMLLYMDEQLVKVPAKLDSSSSSNIAARKQSLRNNTSVTIDLNQTPSPITATTITPGQSASSGSLSSSGGSSKVVSLAESDSEKPLISNQTKGNVLIAQGVSPLQLAILYGRISMIKKLYETEKKFNQKGKFDLNELRSMLMKAFWLNKLELANVVRKSTLKLLLVLDLSLILLLCLPGSSNDHHHHHHQVRGLELSLFVGSFCLTMMFAFRVMLKEPGYLKQNSAKYKKEFDLLLKNSSSSNELDKARLLCHKCRCVRCKRSRHCNYCQRCVEEFDHHCLYLSCCIGRQNRLDFLILMILMTITSLYGSVIYYNAISYYDNDNSGSSRRKVNYFSWHFIGFLSIFKYALIGLISSFCILRRASLGITMYEEVRSRRIRGIFGHRGPPDEISKRIKAYSIKNNDRDSFWRYTPNRFSSGDLKLSKIMNNLKEFFTPTCSPLSLLINLFASDTPLKI